MEVIINNQKSINDYLKKLKNNDVLILEDGIYNEKVEIWQEGITIKALNKHKAIIANKDYYHKIMPNHNECNTFNTFTLYVGANNVTIENIIIRNDATPSNIYGQAVALHVDGNNFTCNSCIIESAQDTLLTGPMPPDLIERYKGFYPQKRLKGLPSKQIYNNCKIIGDVDYIFGTAVALFNECNIISLPRADKNGYICAPAHNKDQKFGYLFYKCNIEAETETYLGRPWRDYGCAAFIKCQLTSSINPLGFNKWNNTHRDKTARFYEYTENVDLTKREPWVNQLSSNEAEKYVEEFMTFIKK